MPLAFSEECINIVVLTHLCKIALPGKNPPSLDKQFVRDWLDSVHFNHQPPAPELPQDIVEKTAEKYRSALDVLKK